METRNQQWNTWLEFCEEDGRRPLPVTEAHFVAFIGWLTLERGRGGHQICSSSVPQYMSAVRQMQLTLTGVSVQSYPFVQHVLRAYKRWEEDKLPMSSVRCGISADSMQRIWGLGMSTTSIRMLRDTAACVLAFCFNGLRESSVLSLEEDAVVIHEMKITARLCVVKGQAASRVPLVAYHRHGNMASPIDLLKKWTQARGRHPRFFGIPGEVTDWPRQGLTRAVKVVLQEVGVDPPAGGKFTSHSLRIGAHTEQLLIGLPLEVRLARFGWGPNSQEMAALYFDRTIQVTAASFWFFGSQDYVAPVSIPPQA